MINLYTIEELRIIEKQALSRLPPGTLMQRAGQEAAELALRILPANHENTYVLVLAGPGNNGGDALEMAIVLAEKGINVSVLSLTSKKTPTEESRLAKKRALHTRIKWKDTHFLQDTIQPLSIRQWDLIVDGIFGIGLKKPLDGNFYQLAKIASEADCPIIALDVPSGLDADTGSVHGKNGIAVKATHTITFLGNKPGLYTHQGKDHAGEVHHVRLGIDESSIPSPQRWLNQPALFSSILQKRKHNTHKGTYGRVAILGGATGMSGAPILAARTALYCGAGLVYAVYLKNPPQHDGVQPELMYRAANHFDFSSVVSVIGPGLGTSGSARKFIRNIMLLHQPLILDADALNIVSEEPELQEILENRRSPAILTPHPLEAARLLKTSTEKIQSDRLSAANTLARRFHAAVALKGSGTVIADHDGKIAVNPTGGPALATAGTGDVLSGICGALLAQGWPAWETTLAAVWLHGRAADELVMRGKGPVGLTASELIPETRRILNNLIRECAR